MEAENITHKRSGMWKRDQEVQKLVDKKWN